MHRSRLIQLDFLRACCVLLVLGRHLEPFSNERYALLSDITLFWNFGGWIGVDIFFVLSGFLVAGLIFREYKEKNNVEIKRFLIRRGLKIYPSFYLLILATVLINPLFNIETLLKPLLAELFFLQNLIFGRLWAHTWSLAVEEHFYIGLAILAFILLRRKITGGNPFDLIPRLFVLTAIVCFVLRLLMAIFKGTNISPTPFRIDALFFGVTLAYLWHFRDLAANTFVRRYRFWLIAAGVAGFTPMFFFMSVIDPIVFVFGLTTNYLAAGCILIGLLNVDFTKSRIFRLFSFVGIYSYSIYLWHLPVQFWLAQPLNERLGINNWFFYAAFYLAGSIVFGVIMSKIVEYPILKLRDKYFPAFG